MCQPNLIAIGSNPGNPYRAFADGTNTCDVPSVAARVASCADYVPGHVRDINDAAAAEEFGYVFGGPILVSLGTLDYHDANGDGSYNYLDVGTNTPCSGKRSTY